ncbi:hypothetical protein JOY44_08015 [Phormidium sp. CLA17]|uniref:HD domain-containing protein n=1 Tax=Leptolyngbya sp. Cla-17 TaxID=2803751 RepID=UPI0014927C04|nr:N-methyl-D-aspartate receptor NMDAR2C subunit [Leptolyngbya sp. Cla-17]MBM0741560.1 hypothetical protein [Leptolyngbya sp. Cla-17]
MIAIAHWQKTWQQLGAEGNVELYELICARYAEPHRRYHTLQHLNECFNHFEQIREQATHPPEVELAIWFHDAIYELASKDNEQKSAEWVRTSVIAHGLPEAIGDRVYSLIMATKHDAIPTSRDAEVLVDVDLGILAAEPERFDEYEQQVRAEYKWVPELIYRRERGKILKGLMGRSQIYSTPLFQDRYEAKARQNLIRSLTKLT